MGQFDFEQKDYRFGCYISDKWQVAKRLTLNVGVRYDYQDLTSKTKDAFGPRLGVAYDALGDGKTLIRGGVGKVYQYQQLNILQTLLQRPVYAPTLTYDTGQLAVPPSTSGTVPGRSEPECHRLSEPGRRCAGRRGDNEPGVPRVSSTRQRDRVLAGGVVNNTTTGPLVDGDRHIGYTWAYSVGFKRELANNLAASIDYVGNQGRNNTGVIDINEGPVESGNRASDPSRRERVRSKR